MSGSIASISLFKSDPISRRTVRYAIGMVVMFAVVFTYNWPGAFLVIIIGNGFLLGPKPTLKFALDFVYKFALGWIFAIIICYLFIDYHLLYLLVIGLIMLHVYYADASVISPILKVAMSIMNMIVPLMWLKSPMLGITVGSLIVIGSFGALFLTIIIFALIPDIEITEAADHHDHTGPKPSKKERFSIAIRSLAVLFPLLILFFFFNMQSYVLILVYVSLYAAMPGFANDLSLGKMMVRTTFFGGVVAIIMYEILVIIPLFSFFMLMVFGLALYGGHQVISGGNQALNIRKGFSAIIFIFGGVANSLDADVESKMWVRVIYMTIIVIYLVLAFKLLEMLFPQKDKSS